jgi:TPR repeat protein
MMLGVMFYMGQGVQRDVKEAETYLKLAAAQNNEQAADFLRRIQESR